MLGITIGMWSIAPAFPAGTVGVGFFLLRCAVTLELLNSASFQASNEVTKAIVVLVGLAILSGFRTRFFAFVCAGIAVFVAADTAAVEFAFVAILNTLALAFTGPGAFSFDARLRGRRTVILPDIDFK